MLNRKRIFAIVLFVLIGLFVYTFANPAEDLEPLDNKDNIEDVDNKDNDDNDDAIQLPDDDNNIIPVIVNAANYEVLRTAVENGNTTLNLETEDEELTRLLVQLENATNNGQQLITNQINDQNLVNNGANTINQLLAQINALLTENLEDAIEEGNRILNYYAEKLDLNSNLENLLEDLEGAIEDAEDLENPTAQQMQQAANAILEIISEIEDLQSDIDIINLMSLRLVPSTTDWTNQNVTLTAEIDIENPDLIEGITIVRGSTCGIEEQLPQFSRVFENLVMTAINTEEETVSENGDYTACVTFNNGELRSATYTVENIDKTNPTLNLDAENSATYRPEHRRVAKVSDLGGSSLETSVYAWVKLEDVDTFDMTDLSTENGFKPVRNNQTLYTPAGATGSYKLIMVATDVAGNVTEYTSKATFNLDNTGPSIEFDVNDVNISEPANSHSVKVKVEDSETAIRYVKYQWTQTNEEPSFASFADKATITLTEGVFSDSILTPEDENGNWYLWILAVNNSVMYSDADLATYNYQCKTTSVDGKCTVYSIDGMGEFVLDNVDPVFESPISKSHTTGNITINVIENNLKEIKVYNQDTNRTTVVPNGTVLTEEATYHIFVTDLAGNKVDIWTAIDRTYPTISGVENGEYYNQDVTATVFDKFLMTASVTKDNNTVTYDREDFDKNNKNENFNIELNLGDEGTYTIVGTDKVGNSKTVTFTIDKTGPTITPDNPNASTFVRPQHCRVITLADNISGVNNETLKYTWTTNRDIAVTDESFNEFTSGSRLCTTGGTGTYYLVVVAEDNIGNPSIYKTGGFPLDNTAPEVTFDTESNNTPAQSHSTVVRATDIGSGTFSTLKYQWTETDVEPTLASFNNAPTFTNNAAISTPIDANGILYLWVLAVDNSQNYDTNEYPNYIIEGTGPFVLDNEGPEFSGPFSGTLNMANTRQTFQINVSDYSGINKAAISRTSIKSVKVGDRNYDLQWYAELFKINPTTMQFEVATKSLSEATWDVEIELKDILGNSSIQKYSFFVDDVTAPVITITTGNPVSIEYNTQFDLMAGVSAIDNQWAQPIRVTSNVSSINTGVITSYTVTYTANDGRGNIATLDRVINIVDTTGPEFSGPFNGTLNMANTRQTFQINVSDFSGINKAAISNASIKSVKVGDRNYDLQWYAELFKINPITMQFEVATKSLSEATWDVVIELEDIYSNKTTQKYSFFVDDVTAPVITITTGNPVSIEYNTQFDLMAGVSAIDNQWAQPIRVTSNAISINTGVITSYTVTYTANDGRGNIATLDRVINVVDTVDPIITGVENNGLYRTDVTYDIVEPNIEKVIVDGVEYSEIPSDRTITTNGIHTVQVIDKGDNSVTVTFTIDKEMPTVSSLTQQYEDGKIKVTVQYSEPVRGFSVGDIDDTYWRELGGNLYYRYYTGTQSATLNFEDLAGNPNSYTFDVDNTAPVPTVTNTVLTKENGENYNLLTGVSSDDPNATIVATVNGVEVTNSNQLSVGTHTINYTFTDTVGNFSVDTATITIETDYLIDLHNDFIKIGKFVLLDEQYITFEYFLGQYTINRVDLVQEDGTEVNLGTIKTIWNGLVYDKRRIDLTKEQYNQLNNGIYAIKITYRNNWLNLDNLVLYYTFE